MQHQKESSSKEVEDIFRYSNVSSLRHSDWGLHSLFRWAQRISLFNARARNLIMERLNGIISRRKYSKEGSNCSWNNANIAHRDSDRIDGFWLIHQIFIPFRCTNIDFEDDDLGVFPMALLAILIQVKWWSTRIRNNLSMTSQAHGNLFTLSIWKIEEKLSKGKNYANSIAEEPSSGWMFVFQSLRLKIEAAPRLIQWLGLLSVFSWMNMTKLDECPVVASTPRRSVVL